MTVSKKIGIIDDCYKLNPIQIYVCVCRFSTKILSYEVLSEAILSFFFLSLWHYFSFESIF